MNRTVKDNYPVIILGDLNIDEIDNGDAYSNMISVLGAAHPAQIL